MLGVFDDHHHIGGSAATLHAVRLLPRLIGWTPRVGFLFDLVLGWVEEIDLIFSYSLACNGWESYTLFCLLDV
jgi:hypothetical protein